MKLIANRLALLEAVNAVMPVVNARSPKVILTYIRLRAGEARLGVYATNMEVCAEFWIDQIQVEATGDLLIPAEKFQLMLQTMMDDAVSIESKESFVHVKGAEVHYQIHPYADEPMPEMPLKKAGEKITVEAGRFSQLARLTTFAAAQESTRYAFNGVLFKVDDGRLGAVSTDGRRLSVVGSTKQHKNPFGVFPTKAVRLIRKMNIDPEESLQIRVSDCFGEFTTHNIRVACAMIEGQFPPYEEVIPTKATTTIRVDRLDLLAAVKQADVISGYENRGIAFDVSKRGVVLKMRSAEIGSVEVRLAARVEGDDITIGMNPSFLVPFAERAETDEIQMQFTAPNRPALLRSSEEHLYVLMPVLMN